MAEALRQEITQLCEQQETTSEQLAQLTQEKADLQHQLDAARREAASSSAASIDSAEKLSVTRRILREVTNAIGLA